MGHSERIAKHATPREGSVIRVDIGDGSTNPIPDEPPDTIFHGRGGTITTSRIGAASPTGSSESSIEPPSP